MQNSFSSASVDFCAVDCIFRAGDKCESRNVYSNSEAQDVMERLLNGARGPGSSSKMNGIVAQLTARQSWEEDDTDYAWRECTG